MYYLEKTDFMGIFQEKLSHISVLKLST